MGLQAVSWHVLVRGSSHVIPTHVISQSCDSWSCDRMELGVVSSDKGEGSRETVLLISLQKGDLREISVLINICV